MSRIRIHCKAPEAGKNFKLLATLEDIEVEAINDHGERVTAFPLTNVVSLRVEARPNEPVTVVLELTDVELDLDLQAEQMSVTAPARPE